MRWARHLRLAVIGLAGACCATAVARADEPATRVATQALDPAPSDVAQAGAPTTSVDTPAGAPPPSAIAGDGGVTLRADERRLTVAALADGVWRVRWQRGAVSAPDFSWAVPAAVRAARAPLARRDEASDGGGNDGGAGDNAARTTLRTAHSTLRIERDSLALTLPAADGTVVLSGAVGGGSNATGYRLHLALAPGTRVFGLGDKGGALDRRGGSFVEWNTDAYHFQESTDPLYKSIPFLITVRADGRAAGVFVDDPGRTFIDVGHRDPQALTVEGPGDALDLYLIDGPTIADVVTRYTALTGRAPLPPRWALGYQQSRYSYSSAAEVRAIARRLRAEHIPADALWLDIDYQDRLRPFTVDARAFPDLPELVRELARAHFKLVAITDLHIAAAPHEGYAPYDSGIAGDHFVRRADGSRYVGEVWPGAAVFPEFTRADTRRWWGGLYTDFVRDGIAGFWNDMNEPAVFGTPTKTFPEEVRHRIEEPGEPARSASHAEVHNVYGMLNSRATAEGLERLRPNERPFVLTRATYAGGQRYAATWTGDDSSTWNHLKSSIPMLLNLGMSGFTYAGADVGGFIGDPSADLLTRWIEIGAFLPLFRDHAAKGSARKEPWVDGPRHTAIRRHFIAARYRLLPYWYVLADVHARLGHPLVRPVFYDYPDALAAPCDAPTSFLVGHALLVAPPADLDSPGAYRVCLPAGDWYDYWSGAPVRGGTTAARNPEAGAPDAAADNPGAATAASVARTIELKPALERLPVFVRAGSVLPRQPLVESTAQVPRGPLQVEVYLGADCEGWLYDDDGHSLDYQHGGYRRQRVTCAPVGGGWRVRFEPADGGYLPWYRAVRVTLHGWRGGTAHADWNGVPLAVSGGRAPQVTLARPDGGGTLEVSPRTHH